MDCPSLWGGRGSGQGSGMSGAFKGLIHGVVGLSGFEYLFDTSLHPGDLRDIDVEDRMYGCYIVCELTD